MPERLPGLHRTTARSGRRRQGPGTAPPRHSIGRAVMPAGAALACPRAGSGVAGMPAALRSTGGLPTSGRACAVALERSLMTGPGSTGRAPSAHDWCRATRGGGRRRAGAHAARVVRRRRVADDAAAGRPGAARHPAGPATGRRSPPLPRHRDDGAGNGRRHARVPDRARLVGGRPLPPGPAPAAGPRRRARAPRGAGARASRATAGS